MPPKSSSATFDAALDAFEAAYKSNVREGEFENLEGKNFSFENNHLMVDVPVTFAEAYRGVSLSVNSPCGILEFDIEGPWQPENVIRLFGLGKKSLSGNAGDVFINPYIVIPENIDAGLKAAANAISQHHMSPVRKNVPKKIGT